MSPLPYVSSKNIFVISDALVTKSCAKRMFVSRKGTSRAITKVGDHGSHEMDANVEEELYGEREY